MPSKPPSKRVPKRARPSGAPTARLSPSRLADLARGNTVDEMFAKHWAHLGGARRVPRVKLAAREIQGLALGAREGFVLSFIDGASTVQMILDVSGLEREEVVAILYDLSTRGVIAFG